MDSVVTGPGWGADVRLGVAQWQPARYKMLSFVHTTRGYHDACLLWLPAS